MDLAKTFDTINDYSKFIVTLWSGYIGVTMAVLGWLITLRSGTGHQLDWPAIVILIVAYLAVSWMFHRGLFQYHEILKKLMKLADELAKDEAYGLRKAATKNLASDPDAPASGSADAMLQMFDRGPPIHTLDLSLGYVWYVAIAVSVIMLALKVAPTSAS